MVKDPYLKKVFPSPPMVAFRRPKNLRDKLIKAKIPPTPKREKRGLPGMKPCNEKMCETCPFVKITRQFKGPFNETVVKLNTTLSCSSTNVVYCVQCNKDRCRQIYVGYTERKLKDRFGEHKSSVNTHKTNAIGKHEYTCFGKVILLTN